MIMTIEEYDLEELKKEIGKYILCRTNEEGATRLFIHRFNDYNSSITKNGWWDTFTVTPKPCKLGYHICNIDDVKMDKNGHLIIIASSVKHLGDHVDQDNVAWRYLFNTYKFSSRYVYGVYFGVYNPENIADKYMLNQGFNLGKEDIYNFVLSEFLLDRITLDEIEELLLRPSQIEMLVINLIDNLDIYSKKFPLLIKKMPDWHNKTAILEYITRKNNEYDTLNLDGEIEILNRAEAVLQYWDDFHNKEKEAKKQARKNK